MASLVQSLAWPADVVAIVFLAKRQRLPREGRMRGYKEVEVVHADQFFDAFEEAVLVVVEPRRNA